MTRPIAWTIAGSDSGGGAGIQADLKTMNQLGVHACSVITALTAQNTVEVSQFEWVSPTMLLAQLEALLQDLLPKAIKLGMIGSAPTIQTIASQLKNLETFVVFDPVMVSTSGHKLLDADTHQVMIQELFPLINLLTPNLPEAESLLGRPINTHAQMEEAAHALLKLGVRSVLLKGGHFGTDYCQDYWTNGVISFWLTSPRHQQADTHGTGCTLSAAITACIALGYEEADAIVIAKAYINQGLSNGGSIGSGHPVLSHGEWPSDDNCLPWITKTASEGQHRLHFPDCGPKRLGFYPIVDRASWLERLLPLGVKTVQLRIKDLTGDALEQEIKTAIHYARTFNCRLFINDYWQLALKNGAYGVHLGQEDIHTADLKALAEAGIRLGLSTHSYEEVSRALGIQPSYMAIGPIFETNTKAMRFAPQGLDALKRWRQLLDYPLVAIAGIKLENAPQVIAAGADSIAVITDVTQATNVAARVNQWITLPGLN